MKKEMKISELEGRLRMMNSYEEELGKKNKRIQELEVSY